MVQNLGFEVIRARRVDGELIGYIDRANETSLRLHETCGFKQVGLLPSVGYKFGHWSDSVMMQRALGDGHRSRTLAPAVDPEKFSRKLRRGNILLPDTRKKDIV